MSAQVLPSVAHERKYHRNAFRRALSLPGRRYRVAAAVAAVSVIVAAAWCGSSYFDSINHLSRGAASGVVEVTSSPGRVVVYYEGHADPSLGELDVRVTGPDGLAVRVEPFPYNLRYDIGKLVGHAVAIFDAPAAGTYVVTSQIQEGGARLAVGPDLGTATVFMVLAVIAALFTIALGVLLVALPALLRVDRRRRTVLSAASVSNAGGTE